MTYFYDPTIVDYASPWFHRGYVYGEQFRNQSAIRVPERFAGISDADWASFCEAILMSSHEDPESP